MMVFVKTSHGHINIFFQGRLSCPKDDAIWLFYVEKYNEHVLMENMLQNIDASFNTLVGFKLELQVSLKTTFVTFS